MESTDNDGNKERPENWMPSFPSPGARSVRPSCSAPPPRPSRAASVADGAIDCSDDDASGATSVTNRCSPRSVFSVVSKFSEYKKVLVKETGFGGLLEIPWIPNLNLKLSKWLLSLLDPDRSMLVISQLHQIAVHDNDVGFVFGIPNGEWDVIGPEAAISESGKNHIRSTLGLTEGGARNFIAVERILEEELDESCTRQQIDRFKIAFVVFVMGHLLVPCAKYDHSTIDFWGALKNPDLIEKFNWGGYVLRHVFDAARKVQEDIAKKGSVSSLTGCHLFLQILFLDNVNLRGFQQPHNTIPRIKVFDGTTLNKMILMVADRDGNSFRRFHELRHPSSTGYMRYTLQSRDRVVFQDSNKNVPHFASSGPSTVAPPHQSAVQIQLNPPQVLPSPNQVTPESFTFSHAQDLMTYLTKKYPGMENCVAFDYLKRHNALMCQSLGRMRSELLRNNARMADWLVENLGRDKLMEMKRKQPSILLGVPIKVGLAQPSTVKRGSAALDDTQSASEQQSISSARYAAKEIEVDSASSTPMTQCDPEQERRKKLRSQLHFAPDPPSFELQFTQNSPEKSFTTPQNQIIPRMSTTSPTIPFNPLITPPPSSSKKLNLSPRSATKAQAEGTLLTVITMLGEDANPKEKVLLGMTVKGDVPLIVYDGAPLSNTYLTTRVKECMPNLETVVLLQEWIHNASEDVLDKIWIEHSLPRYIGFSGKSIKDAFATNSHFDHDIVDLVIRRFNQVELSLQEKHGLTKWRHFLESDFAMFSLGGFKVDNQMSILNQFRSPSFILPRCQYLYIPLLVDDCWCCYIWDFKNKNVHVLDPALDTSRHGSHDALKGMLFHSLKQCIAACYTRWTIDEDDWPTVYNPLPLHPMIRENTGVAMLHLARYYNGKSLDIPLEKDELDLIRAELMSLILQLEDNEGQLPEFVADLLTSG